MRDKNRSAKKTHKGESKQLINAPAYNITSKITDLLACIAKKVGELHSLGKYIQNLRMIKINCMPYIKFIIISVSDKYKTGGCQNEMACNEVA
jgi:hypothetical protein